MKLKKTVNIFGAGFAGIECALFLADRGINVHIFDKNQKKYQCECDSCEFLDKNSAFALSRDILRDELEVLGSHLIGQERKFYKGGGIEVGCISSRLLEYGRSLLKKHKNIKIFDINVCEIDFDEVTVIATGPYTSDGLFEFLKRHFGSMKVIDGLSENIIVHDVLTPLCYKKESDDSQDVYFPFDEEQYLEFCNKIVKARNDFLDLSGKKKLEKESHAIEKLVEKDRDALKNFALRPCKLVGYDKRPYAVLHMHKLDEGYELCGLASAMPKFLQEQAISALPPLKASVVLRAGKVLSSSHINSQFVINYLGQSNKNPNIFFAGGIVGFEGHLEAMASGLVTAYNVLNLVFNKKFKILPSSTCVGTLYKKIILSNTLNSSLVSANYDIMKESLSLPLSQKQEKLKSAMQELQKYVEEFNGRNKV